MKGEGRFTSSTKTRTERGARWAADFAALKQVPDAPHGWRDGDAEEGVRRPAHRPGQPRLAEPIRVEAYGSPTPLNQVANISVAGPGLLSVQVRTRR